MSRRHRIRSVLTPDEWRRAALLAGVVVLLHVAGFVLLGAAGGALGVGVGLTAYTLGMRHAFDVDHIAAIDNTTRKFMGEGQRPLSVGFFFALGHSTVVFALAALLAIGIRGLAGDVADEDSTLQTVTGVIGPSVSGAFLLLIGVINLTMLVGLVRMVRRGELDRAAREERRGFMHRVLGRATSAVRKPWHMYPLGMLFGLGFDTATEVALLATAGTAAASGLPFYAILCLPILFAAGMTLLDTLDGAFMRFAYGWALTQPARKVFYNLVVTGLSVAVALAVGLVQALQVLSDRAHLTGGVWDRVNALDFEVMGYVVAGLFVVTWAVAAAVWRYGDVERRLGT